MFTEFYKFTYLGVHKTFSANPVRTIHYRFQAKFRRYFVIIEEYTFGFSAIKYCDIKDKKDKQHAFKKIFNDGDAFKVISTCVHIMHELWQKNKNVNFVFYAVPRSISIESLAERNILNQTREEYFEKYKRSRFNIYEYAMLNLFPPSHFTQMRDYENSIYILLNKKQESKKREVLKYLADFLLNHHDIIFEPIDNETSKSRPPRPEITFG